MSDMLEALPASRAKRLAQVNGIEDRVYVRGDGTASYGAVMQVMGALSGAGFTKIGLLTDQAEKQP